MAGKKGQKKRVWSDDEKRSICAQARVPGVSVAQVARRYAMSTNLIHKWLPDPRFASEDQAADLSAPEGATFLPVEVAGMDFGRYVDVIGANPRAAIASGVPYVKVMFTGHIMSSLFAVISTLFLLSFIGVGSLSIGADLALNSLAAVILGGVTFGSGKGGVLGPTVAAFMLMFAFNFLTSLGLGEPGKQMAQGAIIAAAAIAYAARGARH